MAKKKEQENNQNTEKENGVISENVESVETADNTVETPKSTVVEESAASPIDAEAQINTEDSQAPVLDVVSPVLENQDVIVAESDIVVSEENLYPAEVFDGSIMPQELPLEEEVYTQAEEPEDKNRKSGKKGKTVKKLNIQRDPKVLARLHRKKIIGKVLASIFVFIFVGSIVGMTAFAYTSASNVWWNEVGEEAGVEFKELFTLFNGIGDTDEGKIVTNGFTKEDLENFYGNLKRKMYLSQDYDLSIEKILSSLMSQSGEENDGTSQTSFYVTGTDGYDLEYVYTDFDGNTVTGDENTSQGESENGDSSITGNKELDKLLQEMQFDFSSLEQYEGEKNILELSDKQLAAFVNDVLPALSQSFDEIKELENTFGSSISDLLNVKQIIISGNEQNSAEISFKITLSVRANDLLSKILPKYGVPSIVGIIIPEILYATVTVYPNDASKGIEASVNRMEESNVNKIVRIIDVIMKKTGSATSIGDLLVKVNSKVVEVLGKAQQKLPITFVPTGSVNLYPIESLMGMLDVDISEHAFLYMLKDIKLPTADSLGLDILSPEQIKVHTSQFVSELSEKYCLDNSDGKISDNDTIRDVMKFAESQDALESIKLSEMNYGGQYSQQLKVRTSYKALAGMLSDYVVKEGLLGDIKADIIQMSYTSEGEILSVDIRVYLSQMLGFDGEDVMSSLIRQLVPECIYVTANVCVNKERNTPTTIEINKTGAENSKVHLQTLTTLADKFGVDTSTLSYEEICSKIDGGLQQGLSQMQEKIGCEILFAQDCAYLPNLFEVVCGTGMLNEDETHTIEPESLYMIMKQAHTFEFVDDDKNKSQNADGFIGELESKYYLQSGKIVDNGDGNLMHSVMELKNTFGSSIDKSALAADNRNLDLIYPKLTAAEFAYIMELNIDFDNMSDVLKDATVEGAKISDDEIRIYLSAKLYDEKSNTQAQESIDTQETDLSKYSNLLPQFAYVTLIIDADKMTSGGEENSVKVIIDGMEDSYMSDFFSIVRKLTKKSVTESEISTQIDVQLKDYMKGVKGIDYEFVDGGMQIDNLFNVIAKSDMVKTDDPQAHKFTALEIRKLMQELYGYDYADTERGEFSAAQNLDNFIDVELKNKYFISDSFGEQLKEYERQDALLDGFAAIGGEDFSADKVRMNDLTSLNNITVTAGKTENQIKTEITQKFKPKFTTGEIAHLLRSQVAVAGDMSFMQNQQVVYAGNDEYTMTITLCGNGNLEDENAKGLMPEMFYVNLTIELGDVLADGSRTDMNVYAMDINSIAYTEDGGAEQDLQLLLEFIGRIKKNTQTSESAEDEVSLDSIMSQIEDNLKSFKNQIHNDVFTVSFLADGGFILNETVYQVALNSVYGVGANQTVNSKDEVPDEIHFRNGLCKINNMPAKYEYADGVFLDFANGNRAQNANDAISEINDKYALARPLQADADAILSTLGKYAKDYATNIDGAKLTDSQKRAMSIEQLRPVIAGEELLLLLESSVAIEADGYQNAVMSALYILDGEMIIVYNSPIETSQSNGKYNDLLPTTMALVVKINIDAMKEPDALCTDIGINDLSETEVHAVQAMVHKLNENEGTGESQSLEESNKQCSDSVRATMKDLSDNMNVSYVADDTIDGVTGGGMMILDGIYEVAAQKINQADKDGEPLTPQEVKETLEALFDGLDIQAYTPPIGLTQEEMKVSYTKDKSMEKVSNLYIDTTNIMSGKANISGAIGGWNIASMIDTDRLLEPLGLEQNAQGKDDALNLKHTALIPTRANGDGTFDDIRAALGSMLDKEYFLITLDMNMETAAGIKMSILPERMDLTLYMDLSTEEISIIYNAMTDKQRNTLSRLVKTSRPEGVGGLDLSDTAPVKNEIMNMNIIEENIYGYTVAVTLGELLKSGGRVLPINTAKEHIVRDENVILGMGAMIIDYTYSIS